MNEKAWWNVGPRQARMRGLAVITLAALLISGGVWAQQKFGPNDVKSVPKTFLEGGDRNSALLEQILTVLKEQQTEQRALAAHVESIDRKLDLLLKK